VGRRRRKTITVRLTEEIPQVATVRRVKSIQRDAMRLRSPWGGVVVPEHQPASFGLGLCDQQNILHASEQAALEKDVSHFIRVRQEAEAKSGSIRLS
jgi:hypothetical protein